MTLKDFLSILRAIPGTIGTVLTPRQKIILSFVGGFLVGLIIFGWWLLPVQWENAAPADLHPDYRQAYLEAVARAYDANRNLDPHQLLGVEDWGQETLERDLNQAYQDASPELQVLLQNLGNRLALTVDGTVEEEPGGSLGTLLLVFLLVLVGAVIVLYLMRRRQQQADGAASQDAEKIESVRSQWSEEEAPIAQFVTTYNLGDDYYNPDFGIEPASGGFLGSCGVSISESIGVGDPKKVTAFEIWMFDTNPPTTVTNILMTEYCYHDSELREKLAPKGEGVLGQEGGTSTLETNSLRVQVKVLEMEYGQEADLPPNSYVTRLTLELAVWQLGEAEEDLGFAPIDDTEF